MLGPSLFLSLWVLFLFFLINFFFWQNLNYQSTCIESILILSPSVFFLSFLLFVPILVAQHTFSFLHFLTLVFV